MRSLFTFVFQEAGRLGPDADAVSGTAAGNPSKGLPLRRLSTAIKLARFEWEVYS